MPVESVSCSRRRNRQATKSGSCSRAGSRRLPHLGMDIIVWPGLIPQLTGESHNTIDRRKSSCTRRGPAPGQLRGGPATTPRLRHPTGIGSCRDSRYEFARPCCRLKVCTEFAGPCAQGFKTKEKTKQHKTKTTTGAPNSPGLVPRAC